MLILITNLPVIFITMANINYTNNDRISGAPWFNLAKATLVLVGGAGGISSWLTLFLTRAGIHVSVYDFDDVSNVNLAGQFYTNQMIGASKIDALKYEITRFSDLCNFHGINEEYTESGMVLPIMFSGFDNMAARKLFFTKWKQDVQNMKSEERKYALFIDGRLLAEQLQIFCVQGTNDVDIARYEEEYLFDDSEVQDAPCTFKQTSHMAAMIAGFMTGFATNFLTNRVYDTDVYELPFFFEYRLAVHQFTTIEKTNPVQKEIVPEPVTSKSDDNKDVYQALHKSIINAFVNDTNLDEVPALNNVNVNTITDPLLLEYQALYSSIHNF